MGELSKIITLFGVFSLTGLTLTLVDVTGYTIQTGTIDAFTQAIPVLMLIAIAAFFSSFVIQSIPG